jgi:hypothetical protein
VTYQGKSATATVSISFTPAAQGSLRATIDGVEWVASSISVAKSGVSLSFPNGILSLGGVNGFIGQYTSIALAFPATVGTYSLTSISTANAQVIVPNTFSSWTAGPLGGSGTIKVDTVTFNSVSGTFSFTGAPLTGTSASGNKIVTNGTFSVTY